MSKKDLPLIALACALGFTFATPKVLALDNLDPNLTKLTLDQSFSAENLPFILVDDDDDDRWERRRPRRGDRWDDDDDDWDDDDDDYWDDDDDDDWDD